MPNLFRKAKPVKFFQIWRLTHRCFEGKFSDIYLSAYLPNHNINLKEFVANK